MTEYTKDDLDEALSKYTQAALDWETACIEAAEAKMRRRFANRDRIDLHLHLQRVSAGLTEQGMQAE